MSTDPLGPEILVTVASEIEAAGIATALDAHGIRVITTGDFTSGFRAEAPGVVNVLVARADLEKARALLEEWQAHGSGTDWSQVDVGEPDESDESDGSEEP